MIKSQSTYYFYGVGLLFAFLGYLIYKKLTQKPSKELRKKDWKKDVVYLFQYKRPPRMANISPYCMKVEMFLRINDIPYENTFTNTDRSQHGLLPFIELNGVQYGDSQLILEKLKDHFKVKPNPDEREEAFGRAVERLVDIHTASIFGYFKFQEGTGYMDEIMNLIEIPYLVLLAPLFPLLKPLIKRRVESRFAFTVGGLLTEEEFHSLLKKDIQTVVNMLGNKNYLSGDDLHSVDCSVFSQFASIVYLDGPNEVKRLVTSEYPKLQEYLDRVKEKVFPKEFSEDK